MAIVRLMSRTQPLSDFAVSGALVTLRGFTVDCGQFYADGQRIVEIRLNGAGEAVIGGDGPYLAIIEIPPQTFTDVDGGLEPVPLDPSAIVITLWPA